VVFKGPLAWLASTAAATAMIGIMASSVPSIGYSPIYKHPPLHQHWRQMAYPCTAHTNPLAP
jgi:hypothetical protein